MAHNEPNTEGLYTIGQKDGQWGFWAETYNPNDAARLFREELTAPIQVISGEVQQALMEGRQDPRLTAIVDGLPKTRIFFPFGDEMPEGFDDQNWEVAAVYHTRCIKPEFLGDGFPEGYCAIVRAKDDRWEGNMGITPIQISPLAMPTLVCCDLLVRPRNCAILWH